VAVGGSAITIHVPHVYTSHDIDLAVINGARHRALQKALEESGCGTKLYQNALPDCGC
jgi:hypothetical protein